MAEFPSYYKPVYPAEKVVSPNVRNVSFQRGGVYGLENRDTFGINSNRDTWNLTFIQRTDEAAEIYHFLLARKIDRTSFGWIAPDSVLSKRWKCNDFNKEIFDYNSTRVTATFVQCFEPPPRTDWLPEGIAISQALPTGTLVRGPGGNTSDPDFSSVIFLCGFDGSNGSTTFVDEGPLGLTLTAYGSAVISTSQSVFGGSSLYLDGSGAVQLPTNSNLVLSADFTLDARCRFNGTSKSMILGSRYGVNNQIFKEATDGLGVYNSSGLHVNSFSYSTDTWYALRWARSGSNLYFFANGSLLGTATVTGSFDFSAGAIGTLFGNNNFVGYIDELRLTAVCRSTSSYTVDTEKFPRL